MTREEAIDVIKKNWPDGRYQLKDALLTLIPELAESDVVDKEREPYYRKSFPIVNVDTSYMDCDQCDF